MALNQPRTFIYTRLYMDGIINEYKTTGIPYY